MSAAPEEGGAAAPGGDDAVLEAAAAAAEAAGTLPEGVDMAKVSAALAAASKERAEREAAADAAAGGAEARAAEARAMVEAQSTPGTERPADELLGPGLTNAKLLRCPNCNTRVLPPGQGTLLEVEDGEYLPADVKQKDAPENGAKEHFFWRVTNMMNFDNIGFSRNAGGRRYLSCADCDVCILGVQPSMTDATSLLVSTRRPKYE